MEHESHVVKLHDFPALIEPAAHLLNSEWPRSLAARCHYLESSSDDLPCSFLLLQGLGSGVLKVVGHSRLSRVLDKPTSVLVESVIVDKTLRQCGLGRKIMEHTENFAQGLGYSTIHLSTHDKQMFYAHLGYKTSVAVSPERKVIKLLLKDQKVNCDENQKVNCDENQKEKHVIIETSYANTDSLTCDVVEQGDAMSKNQDANQLQPVESEPSSPLPLLPPSLPPPPPPLPPPLLKTPPESQKASTEINIGDGRTIWMKKELGVK